MNLSYNQAHEWSKNLNNNLKFIVAILYFEIGKLDRSKMVFDNTIITQDAFTDFCNEYKNTNLSSRALKILGDTRIRKHILQNRPAHYITDEQLIHNLNSIIDNGHYDIATSILNDAGNIHGKANLKAKIAFKSSSGTNPLVALKLLDADENRMYVDNRNLDYWALFLSIVETLIDSPKYAPSNQRGILCLLGLKKIAIERIVSCNTLTAKAQNELIEINKKLNNKLSKAIGGNPEELFELAYKCMRGEATETLYEIVVKILSQSSMLLKTNGDQNFLPVEITPDGECAFSCFGITRQSAITQLKQAVHSKIKVKYILTKCLDNKDIRYNEEDKIDKIFQYLETCSSKGLYMEYTENSWGILDALAYLQKKSLIIYRVNENNHLIPVTRNVHSSSYETIHILHTNANGLTSRIQDCNHFVVLEPVKLRISEVNSTEDNTTAVQEVSASITRRRNMFFERIPTTTKKAHVTTIHTQNNCLLM